MLGARMVAPAVCGMGGCKPGTERVGSAPLTSVKAALRNAAMIYDLSIKSWTQKFWNTICEPSSRIKSKWLNGFLHVLRKYIDDLFIVFRRKWLNLLYKDLKIICGPVRTNPLAGQPADHENSQSSQLPLCPWWQINKFHQYNNSHVILPTLLLSLYLDSWSSMFYCLTWFSAVELWEVKTWHIDVKVNLNESLKAVDKNISTSGHLSTSTY